MLSAFSTNTKAADILVGEKGSILIVGRIQEGDDEKFRQTVIAEIKRRGSHDPVGWLHVYSHGGDLRTAMRIGEQVHLLKLNTKAPTFSRAAALGKQLFSDAPMSAEAPILRDGPRYCDLPGERERRDRVLAERGRHYRAELEAIRSGRHASYGPAPGRLETFNPRTREGDARCECASACFFIWAAGAIRDGDVVGVHRPAFDPKEFSKLSASEARIKYDALAAASRSYLTRIGISGMLIHKIFAINSTKISYLSQKEIDRLHRSPYLEELLIARCGKSVTPEEIEATVKETIDDETKWHARAIELIEVRRCEIESLRTIHRNTNLEYLKMYDKANVLSRAAATARDQDEAEARALLIRILRVSGVRGYWVIPPKEAAELLRVPLMAWFGRVWWQGGTADRPVLGWLGILRPERGMGVEQAASWVGAGASKSCREGNGRFVQGPLRSVQGGSRLRTSCAYEGKQDGSHFTFISRKGGGLYIFETRPAFDNGLATAGKMDDKIVDAATKMLGVQEKQ